MFDPMSLGAVVIFSLIMPIFSFVAVTTFLRANKQVPTVGHRLFGSKKARLNSSLRVGVIVPLLSYLLPLALVRFMMNNPLSFPEILARVLIMVVLSVPGTYIGVTVANRMFGSKEP
jgi:hypothetical protein